MEQEKLPLLFFLNMAWCMTLFRGALQLHFFRAELCGSTVMLREGEESGHRLPLPRDVRWTRNFDIRPPRS